MRQLGGEPDVVMKAAANDIANGDLGHDLPVRNGDNSSVSPQRCSESHRGTGDVIGRERLQKSRSPVSSVTRADASRHHQGDFRRIIDGVNQTPMP